MSTSGAGAGAGDPASRPALRIVRGTPTAEELAVLTALVAAAGSGAAPASPDVPVRGRWNDPAHAVRRSWPVGNGAWRAAR
ncbi:MAG TPA: acyl-CoA carboxylase epsilon subunit [Jatrophihabitantaceae bacterium]|nr:acyl-CoA carboxylase epsilon subunit [Jatrophihabitantaceae bacterium]